MKKTQISTQNFEITWISSKNDGRKCEFCQKAAGKFKFREIIAKKTWISSKNRRKVQISLKGQSEAPNQVSDPFGSFDTRSQLRSLSQILSGYYMGRLRRLLAPFEATKFWGRALPNAYNTALVPKLRTNTVHCNSPHYSIFEDIRKVTSLVPPSRSPRRRTEQWRL